MVSFVELLASTPTIMNTAGPFLHIWDLYQSLGRVPHGDGVSPCVLPSSMLWLFAAVELEDGSMEFHNRLVTPIEAFRIQGMYWQDDHGVKLEPVSKVTKGTPKHCFTWRELMGLAGDSFNSYAMVSALIVAFSLWKPSKVLLVVFSLHELLCNDACMHACFMYHLCATCVSNSNNLQRV